MPTLRPNATGPLRTIGRIIAKQKLRYDLGQSFLAVVNLAFVVIAASDKLTLVFNVKMRYLLLIFVPAAILSVWVLGCILDKLQFLHAYQDELNVRNNTIQEIANNTKC